MSAAEARVDHRPADLRPEDLEQIRRHGLTEEAVRRQLAHLARGARAARLDRPCVPGDGVVRLDPWRVDALESRYRAVRRTGRFSKLVPASGAATRMFRDLLHALDAAPSEAASGRDAVDRFLAELRRFPFADQVRALADDRGHDLDAIRAQTDARGRLDAARPLLEAVLRADGDGALGLATRPKALVPFHRAAGEARTPLAEHLDEAAEHLLDHDRRASVHFTIPQHSELDFRDAMRAIEARIERVYDARFAVSFSIQRPATDTVAATLDGEPFRDEDGRLVFRPGGHGALLPNLHALGADLLFVRNIDNIQPVHRRGLVVDWNRRLGGLLLELEEFIVETLEALEAGALGPDAIDRALEHAAAHLQSAEARAALDRPVGERADALAAILDRPLRVAGVVPLAGEPGGGPFWTATSLAPGVATPQIVESAQIDFDDPAQASIVAGASHFNPVHLVCRLRDHKGRQYDLPRFVDSESYFVTRKSHQGRPLLALEHPGLWNGAMAGWNTVFVEIPADVFAPVKTVFDLLRPAHQPSRPHSRS